MKIESMRSKYWILRKQRKHDFTRLKSTKVNIDDDEEDEEEEDDDDEDKEDDDDDD